MTNRHPCCRAAGLLLLLCCHVLAYWQTAELRQENWQTARPVIDDDLRADGLPTLLTTAVNQERPGVMCHVSSAAPLGNGRVACSWYGGSREGAKDVAIYLSIYDGEAWQVPRVVMTRRECSRETGQYVRKVGNAVIFTTADGRLWMFYASVAIGGWSGTSVNYRCSDDAGVTWSRSRKLYLSPFLNLSANVKNKAIAYDNGGFILPVYHELFNKQGLALRCIPQGTSLAYQLIRMGDGQHALQPAMTVTPDGRLKAFCRNSKPRENTDPANLTWVTESHDNGWTWSEIGTTDLPNPGSGFDMLTTRDGILGVINDSRNFRNNLRLVHSPDDGQTWRRIWEFENTPVVASEEEVKYSYPAIVRGPGWFHVTYSHELDNIQHVKMNDAWILERIREPRPQGAGP